MACTSTGSLDANPSMLKVILHGCMWIISYEICVYLSEFFYRINLYIVSLSEYISCDATLFVSEKIVLLLFSSPYSSCLTMECAGISEFEDVSKPSLRACYWYQLSCNFKEYHRIPSCTQLHCKHPESAYCRCFGIYTLYSFS
jgi:hypothetical protein